MTFNPSVPNPSQAPNLFPAQNSANFTQLRKIIAADHQFNNTAQATDGFHNQCTMIVRATPGSVPTGSNGVFYSALVSGSAQLFWYNGTNYQLTPPPDLFPIRIVGTDSFNGGQTKTIFADPGYVYAGTVFGWVDGESSLDFADVLRSGSNYVHRLDSNTESTSRPTLLFTGNNLSMKNESGSTKTLRWSLIINKVV